MSIEAIIFDLDGTIVDTEPAAALVLEKCFLEWNIIPDAKDQHQIAGVKWELALKYFYSKYPIPEKFELVFPKVLNRYHDAIKTKLIEIPGSRDAIKRLSKDFRLALVSGSHQKEIQMVLKKLQLTSYFELILGSEDYEKSKPDPEGFLKAMNKLNFTPQRTLIFEDSYPGICAAKAANAKVCAVKHANHFDHDQSMADYSIADFLNVNSSWVRTLV